MSNPWVSFYWRDYVADTGHLTLAQHGAYLLLMAHYYMTGRPIPANAEQVHRICRCTTDADNHATDVILAEFFTLDGGVYRQRRIDEEIAKAVELSAVRRAAANAKHRKSAANAYAKAGANAVQMHTQPQPQPQQEQIHGDVSSSFPNAKTSRKTKAIFDAAAIDLPQGLPRDAWVNFTEHRKEINKTLTERSAKANVKKLQELLSAGQSPRAVIENAIAGGWTGLYPLKDGKKMQKPQGNAIDTADEYELSKRAAYRAAAAGPKVQ